MSDSSTSATVAVTSPLRDRCIRDPLEVWLKQLHSRFSDTVVLHEVKIPRPSARADMVVVNGELSGFEIKSDVDSLRRLSRQMVAFNAVFDRISLVTTEKHLHLARQIVPSWWGILVAGSTGAFLPVQKASKNKNVDIAALLHMLSKLELIELAILAGTSVGLRRKKRAELIQIVRSGLSNREIFSHVRQLFKARSARVTHLLNNHQLRTLRT